MRLREFSLKCVLAVLSNSANKIIVNINLYHPPPRASVGSVNYDLADELV